MLNKHEPIKTSAGFGTAEDLRLVGMAIERGHRYGPGLGRATLVRAHLGHDDALHLLDYAPRNDEEAEIMAMLLYLTAESMESQCPCCGRDYQ